MKFNLQNPYEIQGFKDYVNKLFSQRCVVEVKKINPARTLAQNSYLHLILAYFGSQYGCSLEEAKLDYFKRECNKDLFERERENKAGKVVKYLRSSSELTTSEMSLAIDRFRNWSSFNGIYLPDASEHNFILHAQQEIEKVNEFL